MMNISTEYFMKRLANGESMENIGAEMAAMMNAAQSQYVAAQAAEAAAAAELEKRRTDLAGTLIGTIQELAMLEGFTEDEVAMTQEEADEMVESILAVFDAVRELRAVFAPMLKAVETPTPTPTPVPVTEAKPKSDDEILANFLRGLVS